MIRRSIFILHLYPFPLKNQFGSRCFSSGVNFDQDTHSVRIRTCRKTYSERKGPAFVFRNCPPEGIDIDVKYYDSHPKVSSSPLPVIAAFHGVPGSFRVFEGIIPGLRSKGYRVIAPSFPGKNLAFDHFTRCRYIILSRRLFTSSVTCLCFLQHSCQCNTTFLPMYRHEFYR